jgi:hypothetical protein
MISKTLNIHLLLPATLLKSSSSRAIVVLLNIFLILTLGSPSASSQSEDIPARRIKVKPGLIRPHNNIVYGNNNIFSSGAMVSDDLFAYVATPDGLFRTPTPISPTSLFELIGFEGKAIQNLYVHNNSLYILKRSEETMGSPATDHSFLRSDDHGVTFFPMDGGLEYCFGGYCSFLTPTQAIFKNNLIFLNAGGGVNLLVTNNNGASWFPLLGSLQTQICYFQSFELISNRMLVGGECPLDFAYLRAGTLRPDLLRWTQQPTSVITPDLGNRNIQFIKNKPNTSDVYAGTEGGLLKSTDSGHSFRFVLRYSSDNEIHPYIREILFSSAFPNLIFVGGFDKGPMGGIFLAFSKDNGENWFDISRQAQFWVGEPSQTEYLETVEFITENSQGRVFVGIPYPPTKTVIILQLRFDIAAFR